MSISSPPGGGGVKFADSPITEKKPKAKKPGKVTVMVPEGAGGSERPKAHKSKEKKLMGAAASVSTDHTHNMCSGHTHN